MAHTPVGDARGYSMDTLPAKRFTRQGGFSWVIVSDPPGALLDRVLASPGAAPAGAVVVKSNPKRTVFRLESAGRQYYVKHHLFRGPADTVAALFRGTRAAREWRNLRFLQSRGIAAAPPVALGVKRRWGLPVESFLITEAVPGRSLKAVAHDLVSTPSTAGRTRARRLTRAVADLVRHVHAAGLDCPDLHGENILVTGPGNALCLLDVHAARRCRCALAKARRTQNLGFLCCSFGRKGPDLTDRLRFVSTYLGQRVSRPAFRAALAHIAAEVERLRARHIRSRSRRCVRESSEFTRARTPLGLVYRRRGLSVNRIARALELHRAALAGDPSGEVVKRDSKTRATIIPWDGSLHAEKLCVKEYVRPWICRLLPARLRHRNALIAWKASLGLRVRKVEAAEALAVVLGGGASSFLIMRVAHAAARLADYVGDACGPIVPAPRRRAFMRAAADALTRAYHAGVAHRDLKPTNVLVREHAADQWRFVLLDLDAVRFSQRVALEQKVLNLAQLNAALPLALTWADRLRFLCLLSAADARLRTRKTMNDIARLTRERTCVWR